MIDSLDVVINAIGNGGVIGGCENLCAYLPTRLEAGVCDVLCLYVGIEEFVRVINSSDPDPIFMCEEIGICPISTNSSAHITSVVVDPLTGVKGTTFFINMSFTITSEIGTGYMQMWAVPPNTPFADGLGEDAYMIEVPAGDYKASFELPTSDNQVDWLYGVYNCSVWLCEGYCDSIHKDQYVLDDRQNLLFTLTKKD